MMLMKGYERRRLGMLAGGLLALAGCQNFTPPERPVAYVFPTIRSMAIADEAVERQVTERQIRQWLERSGVWGELVTAGMTDEDCAIICRGLKRRGYAEIDVRKCKLPLQWVSLRCLDGRRLEVLCGYQRPEQVLDMAGMRLLDKVPAETVRRCYVAGKVILRCWQGDVGHTEREAAELTSDEQPLPKPNLWLKRLVFAE